MKDIPNETNTPLVNICLITYNHEKFIAQTIESVLMQETNFPYQIIIGEDCSTDRTREICLEYQKKNPDKIRLLLHKKNLGAVRNHYETHNACTAKYIAMLDGDDYWTDPLKLQKQFNLMEENPGLAGCFHKIKHRTLIEEQSFIFPENLAKKKFDIYDIIAFPTTGWVIMTSTIFLKRDAIKILPEWFYELRIGDCTLIMLSAVKGDIFYIDEILGVRRANENSLMESSMYSNININVTLIKLFKKFNLHTRYQYRHEIYQQLAVLYFQLLENDKNQSNILYFMRKMSYFYYKLKVKHKPMKLKEIIRFWVDYSLIFLLRKRIS